VPPLPASALPAGPPAPARAWAGYGSEADPAAAAATAPDAVTAEGRGLDPSRLAEFVGSVSVAGAALAAVGFLLPWASVMIGATGSDYFDRWGLAGPGHVIVVIGILAVQPCRSSGTRSRHGSAPASVAWESVHSSSA